VQCVHRWHRRRRHETISHLLTNTVRPRGAIASHAAAAAFSVSAVVGDITAARGTGVLLLQVVWESRRPLAAAVIVHFGQVQPAGGSRRGVCATHAVQVVETITRPYKVGGACGQTAKVQSEPAVYIRLSCRGVAAGSSRIVTTFACCHRLDPGVGDALICRPSCHSLDPGVGDALTCRPSSYSVGTT
jgi:hypothetical protein